MGIGILAGLALSGPAAQAATTITATFSDRPVYVDGQHISMIAYSAVSSVAPAKEVNTSSSCALS